MESEQSICSGKKQADVQAIGTCKVVLKLDCFGFRMNNLYSKFFYKCNFCYKTHKFFWDIFSLL